MENVQKDMQDFNNLHPNRKLAVFGIILFIFVLSILVGVYFTQSKGTMKTDRTNPTGTVASSKTTTLSLVPSTAEVKVGSQVKVSVMLSGEAVPAADVVVNYDPAFFALSDTDILVGSAFKSIPFKKVENGKIIVSTLVDLSKPTEVNTGEVISFTLEALKPGSSELSFDIEDEKDVHKTITSKVGGIDTLKTAQGTTITIK
ncbi:hypothetical protein KBC70_00475 [Candidatus Woesebacteria bacterium]|nr:hypothetical protein [Candidatus Woesebacteria bacterium]